MTQDSAAVDDDRPSDVADLPPSCKLVLKVLAYEGDSTFQELVAETHLSERTCRWALTRLADEGLVAKEHDYQDLRRYRYRICADVDV